MTLQRCTMKSVVPALLLSLVISLSGCMKIDMEMLKSMRPERAPELDQLDAFVGKWSGDGEMRFEGMEETITVRGTSELRWVGDRSHLYGFETWDMGEMGSMTMSSLWNYDSSIKRFRTAMFDSNGGTKWGTMDVDPETGHCAISTLDRTPMGSSRGKGGYKAIDEDTLEFTWAEYVGPLHLYKIMEIKGLMKRVE